MDILNIASFLNMGSNQKKLPEIKDIPIEKIKPTKLNKLEIVDIDTLANSLVINGQLELVRVIPLEDDPDGYEYELVDGQRRHTAFKKIVEDKTASNWKNFETILAIVDDSIKSVDEHEAKLVEVALQRRVLTPEEKLFLVNTRKRLLEKKLNEGETLDNTIIQTIANELKQIGIDKEQTRRYAKITEATEDIQQDFKDGKINVLTTSKVSSLSDDKQQEIHEMVSTGAKKHEVEAKVEEMTLEEKLGKDMIDKIIYHAVLIQSYNKRDLYASMSYDDFVYNLYSETQTNVNVSVDKQIIIKEISIEDDKMKIVFTRSKKNDVLLLSLHDIFERILPFLPKEKIEEPKRVEKVKKENEVKEVQTKNVVEVASNEENEDNSVEKEEKISEDHLSSEDENDKTENIDEIEENKNTITIRTRFDTTRLVSTRMKENPERFIETILEDDFNTISFATSKEFTVAQIFDKDNSLIYSSKIRFEQLLENEMEKMKKAVSKDEFKKLDDYVKASTYIDLYQSALSVVLLGGVTIDSEEKLGKTQECAFTETLKAIVTQFVCDTKENN